MYRKLVAFSAALILSSCASAPPPKQWVRANTTPYQRSNDLEKCKYQVLMNRVPQNQVQQLVIHCMQAKGYRWR